VRNESLLSQTKKLLRRYRLQARKGLGQHFLVNEGVRELIIEAAELAPTDVIIEIGPGLGVLTEELARLAGRLVAVELDKRLAALLSDRLKTLHNVTILNQDVLASSPAELLREAGVAPAAGAIGYKVVANLPYYITSLVLRHFLAAAAKPQVMVLMLQREVAEVITAPPGRMSLLSISVRLYGEPELIAHVPAGCFYPSPEVDSAVLRVSVPPQPRFAVDEEDFFRVTRAGFSASRKQLANSLAQGLAVPRAEVLPCLERAGIDPRRRAETLSVEEWVRLWQAFAATGGSGC
jgi:16S rRNA (adenine1518-N6/adenine1519-N6)-dimethyltransferase